MTQRKLIEPNLAPGIYREDEVPESAKTAWDCPRLEDIKLVAQGYSMEHVRNNMLTKKKQTDAMWEGQMIHMVILEPEKFDCIMGELPINQKTMKPYGRDTKTVEEAVEAWRSQFPEGDLLSPEDKSKFLKYREVFHGNPEAMELLEASPKEWREFWVIWEEPNTGLTVRIRLDAYAPDFRHGSIWDIKSIADAHPDAIAKAVDEKGYDIQDVTYEAALEDMGIPVSNFFFVFLSKDPTPEVVRRRLSEQDRESARSDMMWAMSKMADCYRTGEWPGYTSDNDIIQMRKFRKRVRLAYD